MNASLESLATACSGAVSAAAAKIIVYPLDWMKLRLSVRKPNESAKSIVTTALKERGILGVYQGLGPRIVRTAAQKLNCEAFFRTAPCWPLCTDRYMTNL